MPFIFPGGYQSLGNAVERLGSAVGLNAEAASLRLHQAILAGELGLYAMLSSGPPTRLINKTLIESATFLANAVLTFAYIDRHAAAPFDLSWGELTKLRRNPVCLDEKAFRKWLAKEVRKSARAQHILTGSPLPGRPPVKRGQALKAIEQLDAQGRLKSGMSGKEVFALVREVLPSLEISPDTVSRARKQFAEKKLGDKIARRAGPFPPNPAPQK